MKFIDVSKWETAEFSTKGTRDKGTVVCPTDNCYYFIKFPMKRENRDYSTETWSEIIVYEVGKLLGFNVLEYNFALMNGRAGCISKNMVNLDETLVEGDSILVGYDNSYSPEDKSMYNKYTFGFVMSALEYCELKEYQTDFIKMLVLDAVFGNSDRHQSNWGFIEHFASDERKIWVEKRFSPIYDSGCCLGREFSEEQITTYLSAPNQFTKYIRKGVAELRTDDAPDKKKSHYDLLSFILKQPQWTKYLKGIIENVTNNYNKQEVANIIYSIDTSLPKDIRQIHGISENRKAFITKVIDERINRLKELL